MQGHGCPNSEPVSGATDRADAAARPFRRAPIPRRAAITVEKVPGPAKKYLKLSAAPQTWLTNNAHAIGDTLDQWLGFTLPSVQAVTAENSWNTEAVRPKP